jgi:hypothetical protein
MSFRLPLWARPQDVDDAAGPSESHRDIAEDGSKSGEEDVSRLGFAIAGNSAPFCFHGSAVGQLLEVHVQTYRFTDLN